MILIIGLGNPGKQYEKTRHNVGFRIINNLQICKFANFGKWKIDRQFQAEISEGKIDDKKVILAKPQTFMNKSGQAVSAIAKFYKIKPENIWVIHDDLDLPLGKIKIQKSRNAAGHKGVQSIIDNLKTKNFVRFRLGLGAPSRLSAEKFVLNRFPFSEQKKIKEMSCSASQAIQLALADGLEKAMNAFNQS